MKFESIETLMNACLEVVALESIRSRLLSSVVECEMSWDFVAFNSMVA